MREHSSSDMCERMDKRGVAKATPVTTWSGHAGESAHRQPHKARRQEAQCQAREGGE
jgi:hypothetical protein